MQTRPSVAMASAPERLQEGQSEVSKGSMHLAGWEPLLCLDLPPVKWAE